MQIYPLGSPPPPPPLPLPPLYPLLRSPYHLQLLCSPHVPPYLYLFLCPYPCFSPCRCGLHPLDCDGLCHPDPCREEAPHTGDWVSILLARLGGRRGGKQGWRRGRAVSPSVSGGGARGAQVHMIHSILLTLSRDDPPSPSPRWLSPCLFLSRSLPNVTYEAVDTLGQDKVGTLKDVIQVSFHWSLGALSLSPPPHPSCRGIIRRGGRQ